MSRALEDSVQHTATLEMTGGRVQGNSATAPPEVVGVSDLVYLPGTFLDAADLV